jgi:hypothetical protein
MYEMILHTSLSAKTQKSQDRTFQHQFELHSPNFGRIRCQLVTLPPDHNAPGGNRPFQLKINGVNFFDFNSIFQLGTPAMIVRPAPSASHRPGSETDPYLSIDERQAIARAKLESMRELNSNQSRSHDSNDRPKLAPVVTQEQSLITFEDQRPSHQSYHQGNNAGQAMSSMTLDFRSTSFESQASPTAVNPNVYTNYALPPAPAYPQYTQQPPAPNYTSQTFTSGNPQPPTSNPYAQPPIGSQNVHYPLGLPAPANSNPYNQVPVPPSTYGQETATSMQPNFQNYSYPQGSSNVPSSNSSAGQASSMPTTWGPPNPSYSNNQASSNVAMIQTNSISAPWAPPNPSYYSNHPTSIATSNEAGFASLTSPQSQVSYGSAPSFAQPPRHQSSEQFGGY